MSELQVFRNGYWDARGRLRYELQRILEAEGDLRESLEALVEELLDEEMEEAYAEAQEEQPGLTREQYEQELKETAEAIRAIYYRPDGQLKVRPVRKQD